MRILLVEDDVASVHVGRSILAFLGHEVAGVGSGGEALRTASAGAWEGAVVDVGLPDADGFALVEELRRLHPELRCVLVTGQFIPDGDSRAASLGAVFRRKPVDYRELADWLDSRR